MNFKKEQLSPSYSSSSSSTSSTRKIARSNSATNAVQVTSQKKGRAGSKKFNETRHPIYRGVRKKYGRKWVCEVREPHSKSRIWLGTFPAPEMAARAHDVAALALRGDAAVLNFPNIAQSFPRAKSSSPRDIQLAALAAAQAFLPPADLNIVERKNSVLGLPSDSACVNGGLGFLNNRSETLFMDEEALFNIPGLIDSMAEGLLLTPPAMKRGFDWGGSTTDMAASYTDLTLWNE